MYAKLLNKKGEIDLEQLTDLGLQKAKYQVMELLQDIENEVNNR